MKKRGIEIKSFSVKSPLSVFTGETNSIVVWKNGSAVVVDPGGDVEQCIYDPLEWRGLIGWMDFYQYRDKSIHFPAVYNGLDWSLGWTDKNSTVDVLRHEFGHALAHRYPQELRGGDVFKKAFGGACGTNPAKGTDPDEWEGRCVTKYAATATQEDFAETFMLYMKHKGKIPARFAKNLRFARSGRLSRKSSAALAAAADESKCRPEYTLACATASISPLIPFDE